MSNLINQLHQIYITITGIHITQSLHEHKWHLYCKAGFTERDLRDVLDWIKAQNRKNDYQYSVRLSTLIGNLAHFDELKGLAQQRKPVARSEGQKAVDNFRGYQEPLPTSNVIPIGEALRRAVNGA